MQLSFAEMFYEQKLDVRDNDVTSHVTILNVSISLVYCLFRRPRVPNYTNMSHETQGSVLVDDVTGHVTILKVIHHTYIIHTSFFRCPPRGFSATCLQQMQGSVVEGLSQTATSGSQYFFV